MVKVGTRRVSTLQPTNIPATFSRTSVAYNPWGVSVAAGNARFGALHPTTTVTNLLTGNQSDGGDTLNPELLTLNQRTGTDTLGDTTGFTATGATPSTISSSTEQAHSGSRSLKVVTAGSLVNEGVRVNTTTVATSTLYITGAWVYAPNGAKLEIGNFTDASVLLDSAVAFTGTGAWQWVEVASTTTDTTIKTVIRTVTDVQAITFYVDDLRLAKNDTTGFAVVNSATISISPQESYQGYRSIKTVTGNVTNNEGVYLLSTTVTASTTYTYSVWLKGTGTVVIGNNERDAGNAFINQTTSDTITLSDTWTKYTITRTYGSTGVKSQLYVATPTQQSATIYADVIMLETGSTAHDWAYGGSSYRTGYQVEQGLLVEEATTNLLTANQSTGTDTSSDTTGFAGAGTVPATISSSTEQKLCGSRSLKCITTGTNPGEGVSTSSVAISNTTAHTITVWVYYLIVTPPQRH